MKMTLGQFLDLPVLARSRAELVHGAHLLDRDVRWVHTSEIYTIAPLLKGGEVLLTTGLGLVGATPDQIRGYVDGLAEHAVTALVLEVGRTFPAVPQVLIDEAKSRDLALVALHGVVPFIEITEAAHGFLIEHEVATLRRTQHINESLTQSLLSGGGLPALVRRIAALADCPAVLIGSDGRTVAASDDDVSIQDNGSRESVELFGSEWGQLLLAGDPTVDRDLVAICAVTAVALELVCGTGRAGSAAQAGKELLLDIALNRFGSASELSIRAAGAGLVPRAGEQILVVCLGVDDRSSSRVSLNAAREAARRALGSALVADIDKDILIVSLVTKINESELRALLGRFADIVDNELAATTGGHAVAVAAGPLVADAPALVGSVAEARESSALVRKIGGHRRILLSSDLGVQRLLSRLVGDPGLERFVDEQLGVLLAHDAQRGMDLMSTLDVYLAYGLSKTKAAEALGIRRQTLYSRLTRLEALLGDLSQRERRTALDLALAAWHLRTSAAAHT